MLTISTFNIQNDYKYYTSSKKDTILKYLKDKRIDILGLQEVYSKLDKDLFIDLNKMNYKSIGSYRFFLKRLLNRVNEKNPIITKKNIIFSKTYHLPFFPSLLKRVITKVVIMDNGCLVSIYNTHLEVRNEKVKEKQLKRIINIIKEDNNPIILMGDFNLKNNNIMFKKFVRELTSLNIKHIDVLDKTFKKSKYHRAIDHVFVSSNFQVISKSIINDIDISDHYPVLVKLKYNK